MNIETLNNLKPNETAYIIDNKNKSDIKKHLKNLGITKNEKIKCLYKSPLNDPVAYEIKNIIIAIRKEDAKNIMITKDIKWD